MQTLNHPRWLVGAGNYLFAARNAVFPLVMAGAILLFPPPYTGAWHHALDVSDALGIALALAGQALRAAVIGYAYIVRGGKDKKVYADGLVTAGFFSVCRNPLYVGNLLIYAGVLCVLNNPLAYVLAGGFFVFAYVALVAAEETYLQGRFGEGYQRYCAQVNRWWPQWSRLPEALQGMRFNLGRVLVKDYSTAGAWLTLMILLKAYEAIRAAHGVLDVHARAWLGAAIATGMLILAVRTAKKARWITA